MQYICKESGTCPNGKEICCYTCTDYGECDAGDKCIIPDGADFINCAIQQEDNPNA